MEITFSGVGNPHAWTSFLLTDDFDDTQRRRLLAGVNLIRPLGPPLTNLPAQQVVKTTSGRSLGRQQWHDPNLAVAGSIVTPIVTIEPKVGFKPGRSFVRLNIDAGGLSLDPSSPDPTTVRHIEMDSSQCEQLQNWTLSDPTLLNVQTPVLRQTLSDSIKKFHEGSLVIFKDHNGFDAVGLALDCQENPGAGTIVTTVRMTDLEPMLTQHI